MAMTTLTGYELTTTFWEDFSIADRFGTKAVKDTYKRAFNAWKDNYVYLTELVLVTNWKIWEHHGKNDKLARLYNDLWEQTQDYAYEHLKDEELSFFFNVTD